MLGRRQSIVRRDKFLDRRVLIVCLCGKVWFEKYTFGYIRMRELVYGKKILIVVRSDIRSDVTFSFSDFPYNILLYLNAILLNFS